MTRMRILALTVSILTALALMAGPAAASVHGGTSIDIGGGLVDVTVQNVDIDVLNDLDLAVNAIVSVPIGVAANVCPAVNAAVLAQDLAQDGEATCDAGTEQVVGNRAFQRFVG